MKTSSLLLLLILILPFLNIVLTMFKFKKENNKFVSYFKGLNLTALILLILNLSLRKEGLSLSFGPWLEIKETFLFWNFHATRASLFVSLFLVLVYSLNFLFVNSRIKPSSNWRESLRSSVLLFVLVAASYSGNLFTFIFFYLLHTILDARFVEPSRKLSFESTLLHFSDFLIIFSVLNILSLDTSITSKIDHSLLIDNGIFLNCFLIGFLVKSCICPTRLFSSQKNKQKKWSDLYSLMLHSTVPLIILAIKVLPLVKFSPQYLKGLIYFGILIFFVNSLKGLFEKDFKKIFFYMLHGIKGLFIALLGLSDISTGVFLFTAGCFSLIPFLFLGHKLELEIDEIPRIKIGFLNTFKRNSKSSWLLLISLFPLFMIPIFPNVLGMAHITALLREMNLEYALEILILSILLSQLCTFRLIFMVSTQKNVLDKIQKLKWDYWVHVSLVLVILLIPGLFLLLNADPGKIHAIILNWVLGEGHLVNPILFNRSIFSFLAPIGVIPIAAIIITSLYFFKSNFIGAKFEDYQYKFFAPINWLKNDFYFKKILKNIILSLLKSIQIIGDLFIRSIIYNRFFYLIGELVIESGAVLSNYYPKRMNAKFNYILTGTIVMFWLLYLRMV